MSRLRAVATCILTLLTCLGLQAQDILKMVKDHNFKQDEFRYNGALALKEVAIAPNDEAEKEGIFLYGPMQMSKDKNNNVYIVDQRRHCIFVFDKSGNFIRKIGRQGQGPGELIKPMQIALYKENIITFDIGNMRIQYLNAGGEYIKGFKVFKSFDSIVCADDGRLITIPYYSNNSSKLIEVYSEEGKLLNSFGDLIKTEWDDALLNQSSLTIGPKNEIYVAFKFFPIVRKYSIEGKLLNEFRVDTPLIVAKDKLNNKMHSLGGPKKQVPYWFINDSIKTVGEKIYLSTVNPRLEIVELNGRGNIVNVYTKDWNYDEYMLSFDFEVLDDISSRKFLILELSPSPKLHYLEIDQK